MKNVQKDDLFVHPGGSCCTTHQEKFGNVNKGETEQVKYNRLYPALAVLFIISLRSF